MQEKKNQTDFWSLKSSILSLASKETHAVLKAPEQSKVKINYPPIYTCQ